MKPSFSCAVALCLYPAFSGLALAQDFLDKIRPTVEFENITLPNGSIQHSIAIETKPGLLYTFQSSDNLVSWNDDAVYYSLGQKLTHALRESTPPPPPDPEAPPAPAYPSAFATLLVQPSSGTGGGTVVSWRSLDDSRAMTYHIAGDMDPAWQLVPMIVCDYDNHQFFFSHPPGSIAPPAENPTLGEKDTIMIAVLEDRLDEINQSLINSAYHTQHTPAPAPTAGQRRFLRVKATAVDTDGDNVTDFDEFLLAAEENPLGNAFNPDADGDGVPDDQQVDTDKDGQVNANDATPNDETAAYAILPNTRYALFEAPGGGVQISDRGTVLYRDGTWQAGVSTALPGGGYALGINNRDMIFGIKPYPKGNGISEDHLTFWLTPTANPTRIAPSGPYPGTSYDVKTPGTVLTDDGNFPASIFDGISDGSPGIWQLPVDGKPVSYVSSPDDITNLGSGNLMWGGKLLPSGEPQGVVHDGSSQLPYLPFIPTNVVRHVLPNAQTAFFAMASESNGLSKVCLNGQWRESPTYEFATDMASDGTAIRAQRATIPAPILINGKWTEIHRSAPEVPTRWWDETTNFTDISPSGWILGQRGSYDTNDKQSAVMLPIRIHGTPNDPIFDGATGVDDFSIGSSDPDKRPPEPVPPPPAIPPAAIPPPVRYKLWVMAPADGSPTRVNLDAPLNSNTLLKLSAPGIKFDGLSLATLNGAVSYFDVSAADPAQSGQEVDLELKFGDLQSMSKPIGIKIMKQRILQVKLHKVIREKSNQPDDPPDLAPDANALQTYLDNVYDPQINTRFSVSYGADIKLDWDMDGNDILDADTPIGPDTLNEQGKILKAAPTDETSNVRVFLIPGGVRIDGDSWGLTNRLSRTCWIMADPSNNPKFIIPPIAQTIAHELGHILVGPGHPDQDTGPAPLPSTRHLERLMVGGKAVNPQIPITGNRLVKAEWDAAERWMQIEEANNRL